MKDDMRDVTPVVEPVPHDTPGSACDHALQHLYEYLDSEMTPEDEALMRAHVAHCSPCLAELSVEDLVKQLVKRSCAERAPETLRLRIREQIRILPA